MFSTGKISWQKIVAKIVKKSDGKKMLAKCGGKNVLAKFVNFVKKMLKFNLLGLSE